MLKTTDSSPKPMSALQRTSTGIAAGLVWLALLWQVLKERRTYKKLSDPPAWVSQGSTPIPQSAREATIDHYLGVLIPDAWVEAGTDPSDLFGVRWGQVQILIDTLNDFQQMSDAEFDTRFAPQPDDGDIS